MPLTTLDPTAALIVVDLQAGIRGSLAELVDPVIATSARLARAFRDSGRPVVLVNVNRTPPGRTDAGRSAMSFPPEALEIVPELEPSDDDIRVTKQAWGSFTGTGLDERLRERGVEQVVLCGVATSAGVESTARAAHELGYHVVLATDAMADREPDTHRHSLEKIFPRLGETATTAEIIARTETQ